MYDNLDSEFSQELFCRFQKSLEMFKKEFDLEGDFDINRAETEGTGLDFGARISTENFFANIHLKLNTEGKMANWDNGVYYIKIDDETRAYPFFTSKRFVKDEDEILLTRWTENIIHKKRSKEGTIDYKLYADDGIKKIGWRGVTEPTRKLLETYLKGMEERNEEIYLYEIRHVESDGYRSYSYALLFDTQWFLFPDFVGKDSGGAHAGYNRLRLTINDLRENYTDFHFETLDISYDKFENKFLEDDAFENIFRNLKIKISKSKAINQRNETEKILFENNNYSDRFSGDVSINNDVLINGPSFDFFVNSEEILKNVKDEIRNENTRNAVQNIADSTEDLLKTYLRIFSDGESVEGTGFGLVGDVYSDHQSSVDGAAWQDLNHNAGLMQIFKVCNRKKHENYDPEVSEAAYLLKCAWDGRKEILEMIKNRIKDQ